MEQLNLEPQTRADGVWTVSSLTAEIHKILTRRFDDVRIAGEISGFKVWQSGHAYFTLKDPGAQLRCVIFRNVLRYMKFRPEDGLAVVARGAIDVRQERGEYQLIVSHMEPEGYGALQLAFEQLKKKLEAEGLFDGARKRPLPAYPMRIGIVTSPKGAVIRDMISIFRRRFPGVHLRLYPTQVQGDGAVEGVCEGIEYFSKSAWADLLIVGRGGGSLEDLWTFNEEAVARAIATCSVPVISAVGHETDFTIADFVADLRAPTPSSAAEIAVPESAKLQAGIRQASERIRRAMMFTMSHAARRLQQQGIDRATGLLTRQVNRLQQRLDELQGIAGVVMAGLLRDRHRRWLVLDRKLRERDLRLRVARGKDQLAIQDRVLHERMRLRLAEARQRFAPLAAGLEALSPVKILERGYSIAQLPDGSVLKRAADAPIGTTVRVRLHRGEIETRVEESRD